jgi:hypothetical protein
LIVTRDAAADRPVPVEPVSACTASTRTARLTMTRFARVIAAAPDLFRRTIPGPDPRRQHSPPRAAAPEIKTG